MFGFAIIVSPILRVAKGLGGATNYASRRFFLSYHASRASQKKINKILTTITSILLSFDLNKIRGRGTKKRVEVGIIAMYFKMSLLLVSKDINHYGNFKGKS